VEVATELVRLAGADEQCAHLIGSALPLLVEASKGASPSQAVAASFAHPAWLRASLVETRGDELRKCRSRRGVLAQLRAAMSAGCAGPTTPLVSAATAVPRCLRGTQVLELRALLDKSCPMVKVSLPRPMRDSEPSTLRLSAHDSTALQAAHRVALNFIAAQTRLNGVGTWPARSAPRGKRQRHAHGFGFMR